MNEGFSCPRKLESSEGDIEYRPDKMCLQGQCYVKGTVLNPLHWFMHLIFTTILR